MISLSKKEKNYALFGNLLGDGHYKRGVLRCKHTNKQRDYVVWLERLYKEWDVFVSSRYDFVNRTNYGDFVYSQVVARVPDPRHFESYNRVSVNRKKVASEYVLRRISPTGLLLWYLDDGSLSVASKIKDHGYESTSRQATLHVEGFDKASVLRIKETFANRFGINLRAHRTHGGCGLRLYFGAAEFRKFYDLVRPCLAVIPESMRYKFNMKYIPNRLKDSEFLSERYNGY